MGVMERLTNAALDAFEDELKCWQRRGTWNRGTTMLIRYPLLRDIGPAEVTHETEMTVQQIEVPDDMVHTIICRAAMEKAVEVIRRELRR